MKRFLLVLLACGMMAAAFSQTPRQSFTQANAFYEKQQYDSAIVYYQAIERAGVQNPDALYNMGNSYFRLKNIGMAVLYYERAQKLAPNDRDIAANLAFARANIQDRLSEPESNFIDFIISRIHELMPLHTQLWVVFGLLMVLALLIGRLIFTPQGRRLWLYYLLAIVIGVTAIEGLSAGVKIYREETSNSAIVLKPAVDAMNQPGGTKVLFTVHEGTKLSVGKELDGWSFVSLSNGASGWVSNSVLGRI